MIWELEDVVTMMTTDDEVRRKHEYKRGLRWGLIKVVLTCAVVLALLYLAMVGPSDAGASTGATSATGESFATWYADEENREWYHWYNWYHENDVNKSWYHIQVVFGDGAGYATKVAQCESRLNPHAVSSTNDHGVFQINRPSWERKWYEVTGTGWNMVYDPETNVRFAKWLVGVGGWEHWACAR